MKHLFLLFLFTCSLAAEELHFSLEARLYASPLPIPNMPTIDTQHIPPGTRMLLSATITNQGPDRTLPGTLSICFTLIEPLNHEKDATLFETTQEVLPSLNPGESIVISFPSPDRWPSISDFIREDYGLRHYEARARIGGEEKVIGTLSYSFSATYREMEPIPSPASFSGVSP